MVSNTPWGPLPMAGPGPLPTAVKMAALRTPCLRDRLRKSSGEIQSPELCSSLPSGAALGSKLFASCSFMARLHRKNQANFHRFKQVMPQKSICSQDWFKAISWTMVNEWPPFWPCRTNWNAIIFETTLTHCNPC